MKRIDNNQQLKKRQATIQAWLDENGLTRRSLARWLGFDASLLTHIIKGSRNCTQRMRFDLETLGFPTEVLPEPKPRLKRGPQKGARRNALRHK